MIFTDRTITVKKGASSIDNPIVLYRGDKEVEIRFTLSESSPFRFGIGSEPNIIEKTEAAYGQLIIKTPNDLPSIFSEVAPTNEGRIAFTITTEMIDEIAEVGNYTFQIRLLDESMNSRATLPEVVNGIEIREPIATEDITTTNEVNVATVGYALTTAGTPEDAFDSQGNYNKTTWGTGDRITAAKLNKIEAGIDGVNKKVTSGGSSGGESSGLINQNGGGILKIWAGTKAEFKLLQETDNNTVYIVEGLNTETSKTYTVTNNLSNCRSNNSSTSVDENSSYSATIIADTGYTLNSANITMGGTDITNSCYSNGIITIQNVTGNIIITIEATQDSSGEISDIIELSSTMPNNLLTGNTSVGYINTSGVVVNTSGNTVWDNYFDVNALKKYAFISDATNYYLADYNSDKVFISRIKNEMVYIPSSNSKFMRCAIQSTDTSSTGLYLIPDSNIIKMEYGGIASSTGNPIETTKEIRSSKFIYGIYGMLNINIKTNKYFKIRFYDISQNFISTTYANALQESQVTVPENAYSMKLIINEKSSASVEITSENINTTIILINNIPYSFIMEV